MTIFPFLCLSSLGSTFRSSRAQANIWHYQSFTPDAKDLESFTGNQKLLFLETVQQAEALSPERTQLLGKVYDIASSQNTELKSSYFLIALKARDTSVLQNTAELLGQVGRMKYVRPLFRALNKVDRQLALDTFEKNKEFYHPICKGMVEKDLGL